MSEREKILKNIYKLGSKLLKKKSDQYNWNLHARDNQKIPNWNWKIWMLLAGRGFGKTRTGAETIRKFIDKGYRNICLLGKNKEEVRKIMIEGKSGIMNVYPDSEKPEFFASQNVLKWKNGATAQIHSADSYESLRGPQFDLAWVDEFAKFNNLNEVWDQLMMTMRLGVPKIIVTTTPKPLPKLHELMEKKYTHCTRGSTRDNSENLSSDYLNYINDEYLNTEFGKQEIEGELLNEIKMWSKGNIHHKNISLCSSIIIAVDPAVTSKDKSDETGIIVLGKNDDEFFVLEDKSGKWPISQLSNICAELCKKYKTQIVVAEVNQGGDMVEQIIKMNNKDIQFHAVRSSVNKVVRAQPISCLYDQKKVFHFEEFVELEKQMISFPAFVKSPDRVDALVIGINYLMKNDKKVFMWTVDF